MFGALFMATGQIFWAVGAVASSGGAAASAYIDYRRDLIEVKRTGRPVVDHPAPGKTVVAPVRSSSTNLARRPPDARKKPSSAGDHMSRCKAKPPGGPTCRCVDGPNRKGKKR